MTKTFIIYKLVRDDGMLYVGTTDSVRFKNRMCQHKSTPRFAGHTFSYEILAESADDAVLEQEESYIQQFNTLTPNGLNQTKGGKGSGHNSPKFSTRGYRFSEASRQKMSESAKRRCAQRPRVGWQHSDEVKAHWSAVRKGIYWRGMKGKTADELHTE